MNPDIKGIISDMDGVILDTEKLYVRFWCEAANFYGYPMETHHALSIRSMARPFAIAKLKGFFGEYFDYCKVHDKRIELMDKFISENGIESKPGAAEFLGFLKQNGYRVALATATAPERTKTNTPGRPTNFRTPKVASWQTSNPEKEIIPKTVT